MRVPCRGSPLRHWKVFESELHAFKKREKSLQKVVDGISQVRIMRVLGSGQALNQTELDRASSCYLTSNQAIRVGAC